MPAVRSKPASRRQPQVAPASSPHKPTTPYPGYMTDEWHAYGMAVLSNQTTAEFRADLIRFGITDPQGKYTAPYRAES